jgi:hypothetical protein
MRPFQIEEGQLGAVARTGAAFCGGSDTRMRSPDAHLAGPWHVGEFALLLKTLDPHRWPASATLADAVMKVSQSDSPPELVLLAQGRPGVDSQTDVERLREVAPLTRIIVVAGTWCEGELRTGWPLTGVIRLYWYEFAAWWRAGLKRLARGAAPPWADPLYDVRAGQVLRFDFAEREPRIHSPQAPHDGVVAIVTTDFAAFEALSLGLAALGWNCSWQPRHRATDRQSMPKLAPIAGIWDGGQLGDSEIQNLEAFCGRLQPFKAPVVALLDFPRAEHIWQAAAAGAGGVLNKPYQLALLHDELTGLASSARPDSHRSVAGD